MPYSVTVDAAPALSGLQIAKKALQVAAMTGLRLTSELVKVEMRKRAPDAFGNLRDSIGYKITPTTLVSEIKPDAPYGDAVETGSKPHWTSAKAGSPLEQWALFRGINPYAVQHSIAIKGTKAHPYIKPTFDTTAPLIAHEFEAAIAAGIKEANRGL